MIHRAIALASSLLLADAATADRHALLTREGRWIVGEWIEWGDPLRLGIEGREAREVPMGELAAAVDAAATLPRSGAFLRLHDGQSLPGRLEQASGASIRWRHPWLGEVEIPIERIRRIDLSPSSVGPEREAARGDRLDLANGDSIEGLVLSIGTRCEVEPLDGGPPQQVPLEVIRSISFLPAAAPPGRVRAWFRDGTVLDGESIAADGPRLRMQGAALPTAAPLPTEQIAAVAWEPQRLQPLAAVAVQVEAGEAASPRAWLPPPEIDPSPAPLDAPPIEISGPIRLRWRLDPGSVVVADAVLPASMHRFGDFELVARDGNRELFRVPFSKAMPSRRLRMEVASGRLEIELTLGRNGPVGDRLRLERAVVLRPADASRR
jgi:hypothetical protein